MNGDQSCTKEARDDRGEDHDATPEAANVTEPIKEVVDFSTVVIGVWVESNVEQCVHFIRVLIQIIWLNLNLLINVGQEIVLKLLFKEVVPSVFTSESVIFKPKTHLNDLTRVLKKRSSPRKEYVLLNRLIMIIIVDHFVGRVND